MDDWRLGLPTGTAVTNPASSGTVIQLLKGLLTVLGGNGAGTGSIQISDGTDTLLIGGTNKAARVELYDAAGAALGTALNPLPISDNGAALRIQDAGGSITVDCTGNTFPVQAQPFAGILEGGLTELIGINEQVDQNEYSDEVGVSLGGTYSGEILSVSLFTTEDNTGQILRPSGYLLIFDADPTTTTGDSAITATDWVLAIGYVSISTSDWTTTDTNGALAFKSVAIPFHAVSTLYLVWFHTFATSFNDAANDDEQLEVNFWYRRDS